MRKLNRMGTYLDWFLERTTAQLATLFAVRPDLASPSPANLPSLAARASNSTSVNKALATHNARTLQVLEAVVVLKSLDVSLTSQKISHAITGMDTPAPEILEELDRLAASALLWDSAGLWNVAPGVEELGERFPAGFGPLSDNQVATTPPDATAPEQCAAIISQLLWGPPVARVARNLLSINPAKDEPAVNGALRWLLRNNFLELLDDTHVYLPRQTAFALRGERTHQGISTPPLADATSSLSENSIQAEASRSATEAVRLVTELIGLWEQEPAQSLRNGGLPVREVKRISNELDISAEMSVWVAEIAFAARLVMRSDTAARDFAPTSFADSWLDLDLAHRWSHLVQSWLVSSRQPWVVGEADEKGNTYNALHPDLHVQWTLRVRNNIIGVLKEHFLVPLTSAVITDQLRWYAPRASTHDRAVEGLLEDARLLGLVASGSLLPGTVDGELAAALNFALPTPVNEIFIQSDLTGMVPGRPAPALESLLEVSSSVESRGGALTVRFTTQSITRAMDSGIGAAELLEDLEAFSVTPLPQPLTYMISDVARRHGQIRVGAFSSYIKIVDESTLAAILSLPTSASVGLFRIADTVLGSSAPINQVLMVLREAGFAPAIEGPDGTIVAIDRQNERTRIKPYVSRTESHLGLGSKLGGESALRDIHLVVPNRDLHFAVSHQQQQLALEIQNAQGSPSPRNTAEGRAVEQGDIGHEPATVLPQPDSETGTIVVTLREAISDRALVVLALADSSGRLAHRTVRPLTLESGRLRALDPERESELTIAIHRIASVTLK